MSESFFISEELQGLVSKETLRGDCISFPYISVKRKKYKVTRVISDPEKEFIVIGIEVRNDFVISNTIFIDEGRVFGLDIIKKECKFNKIYFCDDKKNHVCEIVIDKKKFWS